MSFTLWRATTPSALCTAAFGFAIGYWCFSPARYALKPPDAADIAGALSYFAVALSIILFDRAARMEVRRRTEAAMRRQNATADAINRILTADLGSKSDEEFGRACLEIAKSITESEFGFIDEIRDGRLEGLAISNPGWDACQAAFPRGHGSAAGGSVFVSMALTSSITGDVEG